MKRLFTLLAALLLIVSCTSDRSKYLKVYNWGDYIDESLIGEFEQWYYEQTGEEVKIIYQTFDINETMLSKIEKGEEDFDVVCPSDYIIERMLREDMLLPIDRDFGDTPNYIDDNIAPYIRECFDKIDGSGKNANDYSVGYMWGTAGILYNKKHVAEEDLGTWDIIRNAKYANKIFIKDAPRDVYCSVLIYLKRDELIEGKITLEELMYDSSDESIAAVENYMKEVKGLVAGWEADFGKDQMTQERGWINLTWSGDAVWAIEEAKAMGVELDYYVPYEGSSVWFDGWVIPKYAKNVKAAKYFINFLCMPENAVRNMDVIGYVSAIGSDSVLEAIEDEEYEPLDLRYFFGPEADSVRANPVLYPDQSVIDRCEMMHDWGDETPKLIAMWSRVKGNESSNVITIVIICAFVALLVVFALRRSINKSRRGAATKKGKKPVKK
ncbi:MAG TPA: ABC transporter substrate-binding protein [Bacteroidales bacterium]|nr:ABC transporter substrate-binding protein [Bacteroidales bacterium]